MSFKTEKRMVYNFIHRRRWKLPAKEGYVAVGFRPLPALIDSLGLVNFPDIANNTSLCTLELNINKEITC